MCLAKEDPQLLLRVRKFVDRYNKMRKNGSNALMTSFMEVLLHRHRVEVFAEDIEFQCKLQLQGVRSMAPKEKHPLLLEDLLIPE